MFSKDDLSDNSNLKPLNDKLKISFGPANSSNKKPVFSYDELVNKTTATNTRYWEPPVYVRKDHELEGGEQTLAENGTGTAESTSYALLGGSANQARQNSFNSAYSRAKQDALTKLKNLINTNFKGETIWRKLYLTKTAIFYL